MKAEDAMSKKAIYEACKPTPAEQVELDKMVADIQTKILDLLTSSTKIPHTDEVSEFAQRMFKESYEIVMDKTPLSDEDRKNRVSPTITIIYK